MFATRTASAFSFGPKQEPERDDEVDETSNDEIEEDESKDPEIREDNIKSGLKANGQEIAVITCVLDKSDNTSDFVLEVEGKQLHINRAVLAHYSNYFRRIFFSDFKEGEPKAEIPMTGKQYKDVAIFFNIMFPATLKSECLVTDENILRLLALAEEYEVEQVKVVCQDYIGAQLNAYYQHFYEFWTTTIDGQIPANIGHQRNGKAMYTESTSVFKFSPSGTSPKKGIATAVVCRAESRPLPIERDSIVQPFSTERRILIDKFLLYLHACHLYDLPRHKQTVKQMAVTLCQHTSQAFRSVNYANIPPLAKVAFLEELCIKFEAANRK